jgi:YidC/Oxa1 family membrane protein insertase
VNLFVVFFNTVFTYPLFNALMLLYAWLGDFGLAIVILTSVISLLLLPLTLRQLRTARVMQTLQPQIAALRQQYTTDKAAQAQAIQALQREYGIRPSSSFLALLIQAPIYSGLYFALSTVLHASSVAEINHIMYPFLVHFTVLPNINLMWFAALNASWHISLGLADPTHLLPLLAGVLTFVQMRMAQPASLVETRDALMQISQSMQFVLLLISMGVTIVFLWQFAAGIALYRFVSLILNMLLQYFTTGWGSLWTLPNFAFSGNTPPPAPPAGSSRNRRRHRRRHNRR